MKTKTKMKRKRKKKKRWMPKRRNLLRKPRNKGSKLQPSVKPRKTRRFVARKN